MNSRAITLIATIAVIGIVAVGAGYAYTAITVNDGNNANAKYVTLTQDNGAQTPVATYTFSANTTEFFDSISYYDSGEVKGYKINTDAHDGAASIVSGYTMIQLGQDITLRAAASGYTPATLPAVNLVLTSNNNFVVSGALHYYLVSGGAIVAEMSTTGTWSYPGQAESVSVTINNPGTGSGAYAPLELKLCYGYANTATAASGTGQGYVISGAIPQNLSSGSITFTATIANS